MATLRIMLMMLIMGTMVALVKYVEKETPTFLHQLEQLGKDYSN